MSAKILTRSPKGLIVEVQTVKKAVLRENIINCPLGFEPKTLEPHSGRSNGLLKSQFLKHDLFSNLGNGLWLTIG